MKYKARRNIGIEGFATSSTLGASAAQTHSTPKSKGRVEHRVEHIVDWNKQGYEDNPTIRVVSLIELKELSLQAPKADQVFH